MRRPFLLLPAVLAVLVTGASALRRSPSGSGAEAHSRAEALAWARLVRDEDIGFFQKRIARDPSGALDLVRLGGLYLQRYRDRGEELDLISAETVARRSIANRERFNAGAWQLLESALLGQHRFVEARAAAEHLLTFDSTDAVARATLGEVLLELGDYPAADRMFERLTPRRYEPALAPRYARWLELRGRVAEARRLLEAARNEAERRADLLPLEQRAWYELRLGELALRFGSHREARERLDAGLALVPDDWRLLAARARLALATGRPALAIALGDSSLGRHLDPATLATVGDAWRARGDSGRAAEYFRAMEASAQAPRGGFHRAWYLALLDHNLRLPEILDAVTRDTLTRRDAYGYDLVAWAAFKNGRLGDARTAIRRAQAWGTEDPLLHEHELRIMAGR